MTLCNLLTIRYFPVIRNYRRYSDPQLSPRRILQFCLVLFKELWVQEITLLKIGIYYTVISQLRKSNLIQHEI